MRLVFLMLDSSIGDWDKYYKNGVEATWVNQIKGGNFYLRYVGKLPKLKLVNRFLNRVYISRYQKQIWKFRSMFGWEPKRKSQLISDSKIEIDIIELWPNITSKTINAINYIIANYEFDFIIRGNSSLYIIPEELENYLENHKNKVDYAGPVSGKKKFVAGWCIILSRRAAEIIVDDFCKSDTRFFDDEAIGLIMERNNIPFHSLNHKTFDHIPTFTEMEKALSKNNWIFRFKTDSEGKRISASAMNFVYTMQRRKGGFL